MRVKIKSLQRKLCKLYLEELINVYEAKGKKMYGKKEHMQR